MTDDNNRLRWIRLRKRLAELAPAIIIGLLVVGALGGWFAYQTHANPGVETNERTVATWSEQGTNSHAAEVTEPNPLFQEGQTLSGRSAYFTRISPEVQAAYTYSYSASDTGSLDVTLNTTLRIQSVDDDDATYWSVTESLQGTHVEDVSPGESITVDATINVSQVAAEINRIQEGVGSSIGTSEVEVLFDTQVAGTVNGENVANTDRRALVLNPGAETYSVESPEELDVSHESTEVVESEQTYGPLRLYGPVALVLLSVLGLLGFAVASYQGRVRPSPTERIALEQSKERKEFDDWISTGTIPTWERTGTEIELESLEDLVDVAIDTNERVIEDTNSGDFYVPGADRYFVYSPDPVQNLRSRDSAEGDIRVPEPSETDEEGAPGGADSGRDQRSGGSPSTDGGENAERVQGLDIDERGDEDEPEAGDEDEPTDDEDEMEAGDESDEDKPEAGDEDEMEAGDESDEDKPEAADDGSDDTEPEDTDA